MTQGVFVNASAEQMPHLSSVPPGTGDPCTMVILGATGDLTRRKLWPAIYDLARSLLLSTSFRVLGVDRAPHTDDDYRALVHEALAHSDEVGTFDEVVWQRIVPRIHYVNADLGTDEGYATLRSALESVEQNVDHADTNRLFYLAVPPSVFPTIVTHLSESGLAPRTDSPTARPWVRAIVEKPFGRSLVTAQSLSQMVLTRFNEHQIYRIDHYLGKETVQNLLVLRSANIMFEPLWNRQYISHVQITAAETVGVEQRGRYYEEAGVVRDMFQNHLFQLLTLTAMEPPYEMTADAVRSEKVKVLKSIRPFTGRWQTDTVRAQYGEGTVKGEQLPSYRNEPAVAPASKVPTYAAMKVLIDNWRWQGVPFYLRSGKRLAKRVTEIVIGFKSPPMLHVDGLAPPAIEPNRLTIRVQPDEAIRLQFQVKVPGAALQLTPEIEVAPVNMDFKYSEAFGTRVFAAYGTLLLDAMLGDATLFARTDEVEAAWRVTDPLLEQWDQYPPEPLVTYEAGGWGPKEADDLLARDGFAWRNIK